MGNDRFYVVAGMPIDKVQQYQNATSCQKRYAKCFDTNNNGIFDQNEVDLFNATTFSRKKDNTVIFYTQAKENTWWLPENEKVATKYTDNPNRIKYDTNIKNLKDRKIIPYKETCYKLKDSFWKGTKVKGVRFSDGTANEYQEVFYNNKYMNKVFIKNGTSVIYPNNINGSISTRPEYETKRVYKYTTAWGWDNDKQNYTADGTEGYKWVDEEFATGNYITTFNNIKNAIIINTKNNNKYRFDNCKDNVVIQGNK